jgi:hypothetical protein
MRRAGRSLNPDFAAEKEETAECLIPVLDCVYQRDAQMKHMRNNGRASIWKNTVPLFDFIYHEFIVMLDGFQCGIMENLPGDDPVMRWVAGIAIARGHVTGPLYGAWMDQSHYAGALRSGAMTMLERAREAFRGHAREGVVFGRALPITNITGELTSLETPLPQFPMSQAEADGRLGGKTKFERVKVEIPSLVCSAFEATGGGRTLMVLVNVGTKAQAVGNDVIGQTLGGALQWEGCTVGIHVNNISVSSIPGRAWDPSGKLVLEPLDLAIVSVDRPR